MTPTSRRDFIRRSATAFGGGWLALNTGAILAAAETAAAALAADEDWKHLVPAEADALGAIADQIYPPDDTPGAREIGAVHYMDAAFGGFMAGALPMVREGLADLDARAREAGEDRFSALDFDEQTELLRSVEDTPMFGTVHFMTLCGLFALPSYGGNREQLGWKALGFEPRHVWQPPFGFYDAQARIEESDHAGA